MKRKLFLLATFSMFILSHSLYAAPWDQVNTNGFGEVYNQSSRSMAVYNNKLYVGTYNNNNFTTGSEVWRYSVPSSSLNRCEFNGDGKTDILWRNKRTGQNAVWFMDGVTHIGDAFLPPVSSSWDIVGPK